MKFMKLGSKPDAFQSDGSNVRFVVSELPTDIIVHVGEVGFYLHKFPLLSKSCRLQNLVLKASEGSSDEVFLHDFPGGPVAFEMCAKFCYGMVVTLNSYNVLAARCAAEYLEMTEDVEKVPNDWWIEDLCELDVDFYKQAMFAIKSKGTMSSDIIGEALKAYAVRWLPDSYDALVADDYTKRNRILVETIINLLPSDKGSGCSCRFLLKLLKVVILVGADDQLKEELMNRISVQLHKAIVKDLLLPAKASNDTTYDLSLVLTLVNKFILQFCSDHDINIDEESELKCHEVPGNGSLLTLCNLVDGYLAEVAIDQNLQTSSFIDLAKSVPEMARPVHDALYTAIDIYLKEHPYLTKDEKRRICGLLNVRKLSANASTHAAQNDRLPLRLVVQVLFFEQLRAAAGRAGAPAKDISHDCSESRAKLKEDWNVRLLEHQHSLRQQLGSLRIKGECPNGDPKRSNSTKEKGHGLLQPSRSRRIFNKLWSGKGQGETNRSSETSGSSQSPPGSLKPLEIKAFGSSSRHRRYSVS